MKSVKYFEEKENLFLGILMALAKTIARLASKGLHRIETDRRFKKYGIPINFLKLSKSIFSSNLSSIQFLFELRNIKN